MTDSRFSPDERSQLAAEYALGVLGGAELAEARALVLRDAGFRTEVARWTADLAPLLDEVAPADPPADSWRAIEARLARLPAEPSNVVQLHRSLTAWRSLATGASALAAALALLLVLRPAVVTHPVETPAVPPMTAMIHAGGELAAVVDYDHRARNLVVTEVKMPPVPRRDYQLWLIPADGKPRSLGVMPNAPRMKVALAAPMSAMIGEGTTLAVSVEPGGGSPTGLPTGPVVASGTLRSA